MMPGMKGMEVARRLRESLPGTRVIMLSMQSADAYVVEAFRSGAAGYILKDSAPGELLRAVREVLDGKRYLSASLSTRLLDERGQESISDPYESLTSREREILQLTAEGLTAAQVGAKLSISPRTAELHRSHLMNKLGLHTQAELIRYAVQRGILPAGR
jgi:DNA-binding NarL/FixJ family response regulator